MATMAAVSRLSDRMPDFNFLRLRIFHRPTGWQAIDEGHETVADVNFVREAVPRLCEYEKFRSVVQRGSMLGNLDAMQRMSPTFVGRMCLHFHCPLSAHAKNFLSGQVVPISGVCFADL